MERNENLKKGAPYQLKSGEERTKKICTAGGKASGAARRKKRDMNDTIKYLMGLKVTPNQEEIKIAMTNFGIPEDEQTQRTAAVFNMILEVNKGNVHAFRALAEIEARTEDQKLRKQEFSYKKKHDRDLQEGAGGASNLADRIMSAYAHRTGDEQGSNPQDDGVEDEPENGAGNEEEGGGDDGQQ